ncbi:hypothetical protein A2415_01245 [candidate division WWE3 bacterium RIFOXYC1_FULL_39_7]|uniref:Uncharacterized protein n=1 Tax=candidate division WWE3 bacterium RIFOXYC1_FULL_39_7 TaxID=1802643 RepID=A0A1F4WLX2_UNCKA|nr:MAG: hypothetical protein A2415_01245 [candidate division WWE3 bacterium RIFOXYC1_FULL_39_7]
MELSEKSEKMFQHILGRLVDAGLLVSQVRSSGDTRYAEFTIREPYARVPYEFVLRCGKFASARREGIQGPVELSEGLWDTIMWLSDACRPIAIAFRFAYFSDPQPILELVAYEDVESAVALTLKMKSPEYFQEAYYRRVILGKNTSSRREDILEERAGRTHDVRITSDVAEAVQLLEHGFDFIMHYNVEVQVSEDERRSERKYILRKEFEPI